MKTPRLPRCFRSVADLLKRRGGWHWSASCNSPNGCPTAKPRMPCVEESTGSTRSACHLTIRVSMPPCSASFALGCWQVRQSSTLLDTLLTLCRDRGWLHARGRQRTDSTHVLAAIRAHNRVEAVRETVRHALNVLAEHVPEWLLQHVQPDWAERYRSGWDDTRLPKGTRHTALWRSSRTRL